MRELLFAFSILSVMPSDDFTADSDLLNLDAYGEFARWSPDGSKMAFQSNRDGNFEICVMDAEDSKLTRLTNNLYSDQFPSWSPDGKKVVFTSTRAGYPEIYIKNVDGSDLRKMTYSRQ